VYMTRLSGPSDRKAEPHPLEVCTPIYPPALRAARLDYSCPLEVWVDAAGMVDSVEAIHANHREETDTTAIFDSCSVRAARRWTWSSSLGSQPPLYVWFRFKTLSVDPAGEGDVVVYLLETVGRDTLDYANLRFEGVETGPGSWSGRAARIRDVPAGSRRL